MADAPRNLLSVGYHCEDNTYLSAVYDRVRETATVNNAIVLKQVRTTSGFGYEAPPYALRGKGDEINWTSGSAPPVRCAAPLSAVNEQGRTDGADCPILNSTSREIG